MSLWSLGTIAQHLGARLTGGEDWVPTSLSLDTRTLQRGACFIAIRAQRDGHDFAAQAVDKGATALLVDRELDLPVPQLIVADTLSALQRWGQVRLEACRPACVFGVTGSVGKTSTKDLLAAATGGWKTPGNRNNTLGLPEALALLPEGLKTVVLEMGMSSPGEIKRLTEIAPLDAGVITNIGTAHIEFFTQGQEGIARAKGELVEGLRRGGVWVHLATDTWCRWIALQPWSHHARAVAVGDGCVFGWEATESLGARGERFLFRTPDGSLPVLLQLRGRHHVRNAALAGVAALLAGNSAECVVAGLERVEPEPGRGRLHALREGGWLLDESYNASPDSILACAVSLLGLEGGEAVAVLGCMREQGAESGRLHRETGEGLRQAGVQKVWVYGDHAKILAKAFGDGARAFPDFEALRDEPSGLSALPPGARILVKGSLYWRAERVVRWILDQQGESRPVRSAEILG
jgi:UDP-N-acetylmuramoyl-tripeptide--D-alanyl-D-alanine ligase